MKVYYNEYSPFPAQWIRNLISAGVVRGGMVDERSIELVPDGIGDFTRCHFFAGIGGWEIALQQAGWPKDVPVWTGSCPCQPFSAAGQGRGTADDRHLWPEFLRLIKANRPPRIFGEQVSGSKVTGKLFTERTFERLEPEARRAAGEADQEAWLKHVQTDLEGLGYIVGSVSFPACGVGAPHARQRLYWYACDARRVRDARLLDDSKGERREVCDTSNERKAYAPINAPSDSSDSSTNQRGSNARYVGNSPQCEDGTLHREPGSCLRQEEPTGGHGVSGGVANNSGKRLERWEEQSTREERQAAERDGYSSDRPGPTNGHWRAADWIFCRDNKWRPIEPGSSPLADGVSAKPPGGRTELARMARASRKGQLAGYGNAIVIPQAVEFIRACMEEESLWLQKNKSKSISKNAIH